MTKRKRKGFTIVELVIVIAVIGILAGILIPLFTSLVRDAHVASDELLIRELNNALAIDTAETGKTHETIFDALNATDACGFNVQKINAKASRNRILWDSVNDTFCYLKDEDGQTSLVYQNSIVKEIDKLNKNNYRLWAIQKTVDEVYSTYLYNYNGSATIITNLGLDTSDASNGEISSISYIRNNASDERIVYIRTNSASTSLTVDAPTDVVKHYGEGGSLNIISVANNSYHEYGAIKFVEISKGRIALEAGAEVNHIHVNAKKDANDNKLNEFAEIIISKAANVEMPDLSRDDVEIAATGTLVVALQAGTEEVTSSTELDYVWLTKQGIYEQMKVSNNAESAGSVWADDVSNSTTTQEAAKQIANNIGRNANTQQIEVNVTVAEVTYAVSVDPNTRDLVLTNTETSEAADEKIVEAVAKGIDGSSTMAYSITEVETEMFNEENQNNSDLENFVARIGLIGYNSFADAYNAAESGNTIVILKNISLTSSNNLSKNIKINLNGNTITSSSIFFNMYSNYTLTITDSSLDQSGTIDVSNSKVVYVSNGKLVLESGNLIVHSSSTFTYGVQVGSSGTFEMKGGSITIPSTSTSTYNYCINNSGNTTINGGTLIARGNGGNYTIVNSSGTINITDCYADAYAYPAGFKSPYVLYITGGTCNVSGGYYRAFGDKATYSAGHLVDASGTISISGGYFGGNYYYSLSSSVIAEGYQCIQNTDSATSGYKYVVIATE